MVLASNDRGAFDVCLLVPRDGLNPETVIPLRFNFHSKIYVHEELGCPERVADSERRAVTYGRDFIEDLALFQAIFLRSEHR
jgi:hypothetical protein